MPITTTEIAATNNNKRKRDDDDDDDDDDGPSTSATTNNKASNKLQSTDKGKEDANVQQQQQQQQLPSRVFVLIHKEETISDHEYYGRDSPEHQNTSIIGVFYEYDTAVEAAIEQCCSTWDLMNDKELGEYYCEAEDDDDDDDDDDESKPWVCRVDWRGGWSQTQENTNNGTSINDQVRIDEMSIE